MHRLSVSDAPDEFLIDGGNLKFLIDTLESVNKENWYAYYQAGIGCFSEENYKEAEKFLLRSWDVEANPWACHGLACVYLLTEQHQKAVEMDDLKV